MPHQPIFAGILCFGALLGPVQAADVPAAVLAPVVALPSASTLPPGWQHGAFIEIYVRGYADSDGDGIGDLRGLSSRLDYLASLGVSGIWLMPVTRSGDHDHGYAVEDYRDIEPAYGTLADFDELLRQAHARGIGVIVDYVINHSASSHPLFRAAAADRDSPYRHWYLWRDQAPRGWKIFDKDPWNRTDSGYYFSQFSSYMPDWNLQEPAAMAWHMDNLRFWLNRGVDGFRFDAVVHLVENGKDATRDQPESLALMHRAAQVVHSYPNRYVVCEAAHGEKPWAGEEACGGAFALAIAPYFAKAAQGDPQAIAALGDYFAGAPDGLASMASNHDLFAGERLWDQVGGDRASYRLAAAAYLLAPATPFVYYGEEVGMSAAPLRGDARLRTPMSWSANGFGGNKAFRSLAANVAEQNVVSERARPDSLIDWYRGLIALRKATPALQRGRLENGWQWQGGWAYSRELEGTHLVVMFNTSTESTAQAVDFLGKAKCAAVFPAERVDGQRFDVGPEAKGRAEIPARSLLVLSCAQS
jgi:alpha-amylase